MRLPTPPDRYDRRHIEDVQREVERADDENLKRNRNIQMPPTAFIILASPDGSTWKLTVDNSGVLTAAAYP